MTALVGHFPAPPAACVVCFKHARVDGQVACATCLPGFDAMIPFDFTALVPVPGHGLVYLAVAARHDPEPGRLDDALRLGHLSYVVVSATDEAGAVLDPQLLNNGPAIDAMRDDAWLALSEAVTS